MRRERKILQIPLTEQILANGGFETVYKPSE